ncbi:MAG TPA: hypothetical protein VJ124_04000 [Pyrinomonadaceae bacterium]|nr:hypothetical protein [Pyrinomonadaceae bacterium]
MVNRIITFGLLALSYLLLAASQPAKKVEALFSIWSGAAAVRSAVSSSESEADFSLTTERPAIYAVDPNDVWNRIFACLFTRTFRARLSNEFKEGAPFTQIEYTQFPHELSLSTRLFERVEIGDRGIEPLYPAFFTSEGVSRVLSEPIYSQLNQALTDALEEKRARPPLERALMQSDIWAAYDLLYRYSSETRLQFQEQSDRLLLLLARFTKKLALTSKEIEQLPDNYAAAAKSSPLPRFFDQVSGWLEIQWRPSREHDHSADYRRATRVFVRPASIQSDKLGFLNSLPNAPDPASKLDAGALVTQNLLLDSSGRVVPSRLTYDVQLRRFIKDSRGALVRTEVAEYELSRRLLLLKPSSGGLVVLGSRSDLSAGSGKRLRIRITVTEPVRRDRAHSGHVAIALLRMPWAARGSGNYF